MIIFRENTEDIYAGIEWAGGSADAQKVLDFVQKEFPQMFGKIRFGTAERNAEWQAALEGIGAPEARGAGAGRPRPQAGVLPGHRAPGAQRDPATRSRNKSKSVTLVHKGNIMKFTEGGFRDWGYQVAKDFYGAVELDGGPWMVIPEGKPGAGLVIKDAIADAFLQQILLRPAEYDVVATLNLNGDYLSRRAGRAGRRHRHRAGRQHQLRHRPRGVRGHPRHGAEVRRPGQGQPGLGDPVGRDDAALHGLDTKRPTPSSRRWTRRSPASASPTISPA